MTPADVMAARLRGDPDPVKEQQQRAKSGACNAAQVRAWIRVFYGNPMTGEAWPEEYGVTGRAYPGYDGITPCMNGARINTSAVVAIICSQKNGWTRFYKHPDFTPGVWSATEDSTEPGYAAQVFHNGQLYANCKSLDQARRLADFMAGRRMTKGGRAAKD